MPKRAADPNRRPTSRQRREALNKGALLAVNTSGPCTSVMLEGDLATAKCRYLIPSKHLLLDVTVLGI
jgi:hypothetical protein